MIQEIEKHLMALISKGLHPGISFAFISKNSSIVRSLGEKRMDSGEPLATDTAFEIGSLTKLFVALLYSDLFLNNTLKPSTRIDEVMTFLKGMPTGSIKLNELLTHTSGLVRLPRDLKYKDFFDPYADFSKEMLDLEMKLSRCENRGHYCYSNLGYAVLGNILEIVLGKSLDSCLNDHIFSQLNMHESFLMTSDKRMENMSIGHRKNLEIQRPWEMGRFQAAGGVKSTIKDMATFANFCLNDRDHKLSRAFELSAQSYINAQGMRLGYGWHILSNGDLSHEGGTYGFRSSITISHTQDKALVVLANSCNEIEGLSLQRDFDNA